MSTKHYVTAVRNDRKIGVRDPASRDYVFLRKPPPPDVLDRIADEKFSGGFNLSRKNLCPKCFTYRPTNGKCGC